MDFNNIRALLVGAGGIGCELLKTLCLHNFKEIFIVFSPLLPSLMSVDRFRHHRFVQFKSTIPLPITTHQEIKGAGIRISKFKVCNVRSRKKLLQSSIRASTSKRVTQTSKTQISTLNSSRDLILFLMRWITWVSIWMSDN